MKTINLEIQVPDWAEYVAQDDSGSWMAFSDEPELEELDGWWRLETGSEVSLTIGRGKPLNWQQSLRKV